MQIVIIILNKKTSLEIFYYFLKFAKNIFISYKERQENSR